LNTALEEGISNTRQRERKRERERIIKIE